MANCLEIREKKKRTFKKADKEFGFFEHDGMRTPSSHFNSKRSSYKDSYHNSNEDSPNHYWEKRGGRKHYRDDYRGTKSLQVDSAKESTRSETMSKSGENNVDVAPLVAPVILTRERSSAESAPTNQRKEAEPPKPAPPPSASSKSYQIASKVNALEGSIIPDQFMNYSVKFVDDSLHIAEDLSPYLLDQSHFLVLAVIGLQGTGKSTIASFLADPKSVDNFTLTNSLAFRPESKDEVLRGCHSTIGVDAFITKNRVIVLDFQPLLSPSVMDYIVNQERKTLDYSSTENLLEIESLQLLTYAMSITHVLVVVQDYIIQPNLIRLLHTCQMMKPHPSSTTSSTSSNANRDTASQRLPFDALDGNSYFPHVVFIHNRALPYQFTPKSIEDMQSLYQASLADSSLCLESQIGICSGTFCPSLSTSSSAYHINLFLIPDCHSQENCAVSFMDAMKEMRRQIFSLSRCPLTHVTLTEKTWYQYACRMWETIRKSSLYVEYSRLLP